MKVLLFLQMLYSSQVQGMELFSTDIEQISLWIWYRSCFLLLKPINRIESFLVAFLRKPV